MCEELNVWYFHMNIACNLLFAQSNGMFTGTRLKQEPPHNVMHDYR